jgi:hypothetical protein
MPGALLIPDYEKRVQIEGVGLTKQQFMAHAIMPTLRSFGTTRSDLVRIIRAQKAREEERRRDPDEVARPPELVTAA